MSTIAPVYVEFRCNRCWYSNCADSEDVGTEVGCRNCGQQLTVPEATPDRIERALALLQEAPELLGLKASQKANVAEFDHQHSDQELLDIARRQSIVPLNQMDFSGYPLASIMARLVANILDSVFLVFSMVIGLLFYNWMGTLGLVGNSFGRISTQEDPSLDVLLAMGLIPAFFVIGQWILLATSGQTIGKKLLRIRIVREGGRVPGFLQAVVMRNWLRFAFSFIPFFAFVDVIFIFSESRRCLHDYIAGTRVVTLV